MTNYNDGKIHGWNGGERPVHPETVVEVWWRNSTCDKDLAAGLWDWQHDNDGGDIIAFRVVKEYCEPKTIWVNEYADGTGAIHQSEGRARKLAGSRATRIAVKYVEVIE